MNEQPLATGLRGIRSLDHSRSLGLDRGDCDGCYLELGVSEKQIIRPSDDQPSASSGTAARHPDETGMEFDAWWYDYRCTHGIADTSLSRAIALDAYRAGMDSRE